MSLTEHYAVSQIRVGWSTKLQKEQDASLPKRNYVSFPGGKKLYYELMSTETRTTDQGVYKEKWTRTMIRHGTDIKVEIVEEFQTTEATMRGDYKKTLGTDFYIVALDQEKALGGALNTMGDNTVRYDKLGLEKTISVARTNLVKELRALGFQLNDQDVYEELYSEVKNQQF